MINKNNKDTDDVSSENADDKNICDDTIDSLLASDDEPVITVFLQAQSAQSSKDSNNTH